MAQSETDLLAPDRMGQGVNTAPTLSAAEENRQLRAEVERLRAIVEQQGLGNVPQLASGRNVSKITYADHPSSGARLAGITKPLMKSGRIRETTEFPYLPQPSVDMAQLEADFMRWGYCIVKDACSPEQVQVQVDRLVDQAAAERACKIANMSHHGQAQMLGNLVSKGEVFRDVLAFEPSACQGGPIVEELLRKTLGPGFYLGTAHGSIVHKGGGLQDMHQDQGHVPLPHPPYPLLVLLIWTFSDFSLENGGTYIVPGSHVDERGENVVRPDSDYERAAEQEPGMLSLNCGPGQCFVMDGRLLHCGGRRTAEGTRYGMRNLYIKGFMRQQENTFLGVSDDDLDRCSPKLQELIGFKPFQGFGMVHGNGLDPGTKRVPIGELSMSRPNEFGQDFDVKHTKYAEHMARDEHGYFEYLGPRRAKL